MNNRDAGKKYFSARLRLGENKREKTSSGGVHDFMHNCGQAVKKSGFHPDSDELTADFATL
jgi:hypothetical protein